MIRQCAVLCIVISFVGADIILDQPYDLLDRSNDTNYVDEDFVDEDLNSTTTSTTTSQPVLEEIISSNIREFMQNSLPSSNINQIDTSTVEIREGDFSVPEHYLVADFILKNYNKGYIPKRVHDGPIKVSFAMELYQIIQINEPLQYLLLNAWIVERWKDNLLGWDPMEFYNVSEVMVPVDKVWIPDTTMYNSLIMDDDNTKRLMHVKLKTMGKGKGALVELLYPTICKLSCILNLRFFPFDMQSCKLTFGSWTFDNTLIDYFPSAAAMGTTNCIENEAWEVLSTTVQRLQKHYSCCPNNYTLLEFYVNVQRKPLYYVINLITPTSIITLISIIGFFSSSSINDLREEKITLGITTLLSMSILIFMVSDKMPSTSSFIPLIGWFYTSMILLISFATIAASIVIYVQKQGILGNPPSKRLMTSAQFFARLIGMEMPLIMKQAYIQKAREEKLRRQQLGRRKSLWKRATHVVKTAQAFKRKNTEPIRTNGVPSEYKTIGKGMPFGPKASLPLRNSVSFHSEPGERMTKIDLEVPSWDERSLSYIDDVESPSLKNNPSEGSYDSVVKPSEVLVPGAPSRNLAQLEFDWVAAVVERVFLLFFIILFLLTAVGINVLGFYYWLKADK